MPNGKTNILTPEQWQAAKDDYVYNGLSQTKIAEKYNVASSTVGMRASRESWLADKKKAEHTKCQAVADTLTQTRLDGSPEEIVEKTATLLLNKLAERFAALLMDDMSPTAIKSYTSALKDLKEILKNDDNAVRQIEVVFNNAGDESFNG